MAGRGPVGGLPPAAGAGRFAVRGHLPRSPSGVTVRRQSRGPQRPLVFAPFAVIALAALDLLVLERLEPGRRVISAAGRGACGATVVVTSGPVRPVDRCSGPTRSPSPQSLEWSPGFELTPLVGMASGVQPRRRSGHRPQSGLSPSGSLSGTACCTRTRRGPSSATARSSAGRALGHFVIHAAGAF